MADAAENNEQQNKKARIDKEEPAVMYATPQTLCIVANSDDGSRRYYWNQGGQLNDLEKKLIACFLVPDETKKDNDKWGRSVIFYETFSGLVKNKTNKLDFSIILEDVAAYDNTITIDDLKSVVVENDKWERGWMTDKNFQQRTKNGELPLRVIFVDDWC